MNKLNQGGHSLELQAIRGLAAALVLVHHSLRVLADHGSAFWFSETILNAHGAVVLFFVLSGYVLTRSLSSREFSLSEIAKFWTRRVFRIYPALWVALAMSIIYITLFERITTANFSPWATSSMQQSALSPASVFFAVTGLGSSLLPPSWTITVELVGSVFLPLMALVMAKGPRSGFLVILFLACLSLLFESGAKQVPLYLVHFALGGWVAISPMASRLTVSKFMILAAALVLMYFRQVWQWEYHDPVPSLIEGLSAAVLISGLLQNEVRFLKRYPLVLLGDLSYSLYLIHVPISYSLGKVIDLTLNEKMSITALSILLAFMTFAFSLALSWVIFGLVEKPGIRLGRILLSKFESPQQEDTAKLRIQGILDRRRARFSGSDHND